MDKSELKIYLKDNPEYIRGVLEGLGCHHIKIVTNKRVQSSLPDGDNPTSIHIKLNDNLSTKIYTRNEFNNYETKDFITLVQYLNNCEFSVALEYVFKYCNIDYTANYRKKVKSNSVEFLKKYKRSINKNIVEEEYKEKVLPEFFTERFVKGSHIIYLRDGVSEKTQDKFGISYDALDDRIVTPIRNDEGELITFKGRTCREDYKVYGIPKFIYYYPFSAEYYLYGLYENYFDIISADEILVFEAEKAVMQCDTMGVNNVFATSKKVISDIQVKKILKLGKPIVIGFDKDVSLEEIYIECRKFKGLIDVYYIYDTLGLLKGKESPTDKGINVLQKLLNNCKFKYKGE